MTNLRWGYTNPIGAFFQIRLRRDNLLVSHVQAGGTKVFRNSWADEVAPIVGMVIDLNSAKHHVFAYKQAPGAQEGCYFEMQAPGKVARIKLTVLEVAGWTAPGQHDRAASLLRYLIHRQLVKLR